MKYILSLIFVVLFCAFSAGKSFAIEDPLHIPNNRIGIHILFPGELTQASQLVNSNGGDWGYVTIPIQSGDRDLVKWQAFMDQCGKLHLIPIIRLATEGDYFNTKVWRKPAPADVLDFSNFLNSLVWPTKNHYVLVFNEVNRGDEWGGQPDPADYASLLSYAVTVFKSKSENFFIISAGLDNAAANTNDAMNEYTYLQAMNQAVPGIFNQIDGLGSHSYPNPAFSMPPSVKTSESITSFQYEKALTQRLSGKDLPIFITETGWSQSAVGEASAASYLQTALSSTWTDASIVAITPFLLQAGGGPFGQFSFLNSSGGPNKLYTTLSAFPKVKGQPTVTKTVLAATSLSQKIPTETFTIHPQPKPISDLAKTEIKIAAKWLLKL